MPTSPEPATGLRVLFDLAAAAGAQRDESGTVQLPVRLGTGFIRLLAPEPGLLLAIHHYTLVEELVLRRPADETQPEKLLVSFYAFDPAPVAGRPLSTAQITSTTIALTTTLPAQTPIFIVALAIDRALLAAWLPGTAGPLPELLAGHHPVALDTRLTPELQAVLRQVTAPRPAHALDAFFYKTKCQELLYWLLRELADRAAGPVRPLHSADATKIFRVREALLATLSQPPNLAALAQTAGLSETTMRQLFRQVFGTSPYQYYQQARLEEAARQLPSRSVSEVGYGLGFTNLSHFARLFEQQHGLPPQEVPGGPPKPGLSDAGAG